jgi:hypothetical protein
MSHISAEGGENNRVDDCISIALVVTGNMRGFRIMQRKRYTVLYSMWASSWKDMDAPANKQEEMTTIHVLFKRHHIARIVKIEMGTRYDPSFEQNVNKFAERFGLEVMSMTGTSEIVERGYVRAKNDMIRKFN